jgi:predicted transcriptional regulator|tara:strand:+ start:231 stop:1202 length:972 start_codon:yes stop_codon:yes gene_type:complete
METLISSQIRKEELTTIFEKNYQDVSPLWSKHQLEWLNGIFQSYRDHEKYLIVIYLIKKTFDLYSKNFIKQSFSEYFKQESIEIDKFNVMEISKALDIPKESARRKINELQKSGAIKRKGKRIVIDKSSFRFVKPENSIIRISRFLSNLSSILYKEKILDKKIDSTKIQDCIEKNFSFIWKLYYEVQIPMILNWKFCFKDIETFHIWAVCVVNQKINSQKEVNNKMNKKVYIEKYFFNLIDINGGINAMSISDISGIPRATVIRKLNILIKNKYLKINDKKLYTLAKDHVIQLSTLQKKNFINLAEFTSRVINLMKAEEKKFN